MSLPMSIMSLYSVMSKRARVVAFMSSMSIGRRACPAACRPALRRACLPAPRLPACPMVDRSTAFLDAMSHRQMS